MFRLLSLRLHGLWLTHYKGRVAMSREEVKSDTAQTFLQGSEGFTAISVDRSLGIIELSA